MEIQKENHLLEQFEKTKTFKRFFSTLLRFDEELDCFIATEKWRDKEAELLTAAQWMFAEVATAQPVPESFEKAYSEIFSPIIKRPYPRLENGDYKHIEIDQGWKLWQAATSQAVLEKDAIIQKLSDQLYAQEMKTSGARVLCETACELLDGYAHQDAMVIINDLEQAMKEPAND